MKLTNEARALLQQLIGALNMPATFTGSAQFTINYRDGKVGKTTVATEETWKA